MKTKSLLSRIIDEHAKEQSQTKYEYIYVKYILFSHRRSMGFNIHGFPKSPLPTNLYPNKLGTKI